MKTKKIIKIGKKLWFRKNQDAMGYKPMDDRILREIGRQEVVRRTWNI